jgi:hypothetical protein
MIMVSHREGPDPYDVDPLAADELPVGFNNKPATGDRIPRLAVAGPRPSQGVAA